MALVFAVTSGKGGVGKSTVSVGLSAAFCKKGRRVLLVDMDEGLRCLDLMLGVDSKAVFDLADVLSGKDVSDAVYPVDGIEGLSLIPAPMEASGIDSAAFSDFLPIVSPLFDVLIFDFPAGLNFSLYSCLPKQTLFLTVASPDPVSVRDSANVSKKLAAMELDSRLIINSFELPLIRSGLFGNIDHMIDTAGIQLAGVVPHCSELRLLAIHKTLKKRGKAMRAFLRIADRLEGASVPLPRAKKI